MTVLRSLALVTLFASAVAGGGCQELSNVSGLGQPSLPQTSRTGKVHDVRIRDSLIMPPQLTVQAGDEVRFINERATDVRVVVIEPGKTVMCNHGFRGSVDRETVVHPGQSASLCFEGGRAVSYMIRSPQATGDKILTAQISVNDGELMATEESAAGGNPGQPAP